MSQDKSESPEDPAAKKATRTSRSERIRLAKLRRKKSGLKPIDPPDQARFGGYARAKASILNKVGVERYRAEDFFGMPPEDFDEEQLEGLRSGCAQVVAGKGMAPETPLEGISVPGCYALIHTLHFEVVGRQTRYVGEGCLDEMRCRHQVSGHEGSLFNRVVYSDDEG